MDEYSIIVVDGDGSKNTHWLKFFKETFNRSTTPALLNKALEKFNARADVSEAYKIVLIFKTREDAVAFNLIWT